MNKKVSKLTSIFMSTTCWNVNTFEYMLISSVFTQKTQGSMIHGQFRQVVFIYRFYNMEEMRGLFKGVLYRQVVSQASLSVPIYPPVTLE